jgi:hypothetical protein
LFKKHALGFVVTDAASEKLTPLSCPKVWHSADETMGSLRHRSLAPERRKNGLADVLVMSSSCTWHWLAADAASHAAWASACVTLPVHVHVAVNGKSGGGGEGGGAGEAEACGGEGGGGEGGGEGGGGEGGGEGGGGEGGGLGVLQAAVHAA